MHWHQKEIDDIKKELGVSAQGLSSADAERLLLRFGPNELTEKEKKGVFTMFLDQFRDFMIMVLIAAAVISGVIGEASDTIAIIVIVVLNAVIGFVQEYRAEKAMELLKKMSASTAVAMRDGSPVTLPAAQLVPGDVVILEAGKIVPADMRLIESAQLKIEEASLTGESLPVEKHVDAAARRGAPARRPEEYGLQRDYRDLRPGRRDCGGNRHGDGAGKDRHDAAG